MIDVIAVMHDIFVFVNTITYLQKSHQKGFLHGHDSIKIVNLRQLSFWLDDNDIGLRI